MRPTSGALAIAALVALAGCPGREGVVPHLPGDGDSNTAAPRDPAGGHDRWSGRELIAAPTPAPVKPIVLPKIDHFTLKNGLEVIAVESPGARTVGLELAVRAGRRHETRAQVGLATAVAAMLDRGTSQKSEQQIADAVAQMGGSLVANASFEATLITCTAPASERAAATALLAELAVHPSFPAAALAKVRDDLVAAARQSRIDPAQLANQHFQNALWGDDHVRGWPTSDVAAAGLAVKDLASFHKAYYRPNNAMLLVVGDVDGKTLPAELEQRFGGWARAAVPEPKPLAEPSPKGLAIRLVDVPGSAQAHIRIGHLGLSHRDEDFYAATVVNEILGGGPDTSRLGVAVRKLVGGAGAASSSFDRNVERGAFVAAAVAPTDKAVAVVRLILDQLGALSADGPSEAEVRGAIAALAGGYETRFESVGEIGNALLAARLHGFDDDYVAGFAVKLDGVTQAAATAAAARRIDPRDLVIVIVGDGQTIGPKLDAAGLKFERRSVSDPIAAYEKSAPVVTTVDPEQEKAARAVLEAALKVKGGYDKLSRIKSFTWSGKAVLNMPAGKIPAEVDKQLVLPDKLRLVMKIDGGKVTITTVLAGEAGWASEARDGKARVMDFPASEIAAGKAQIWRDQDFVLLRHREKGAHVVPLADATIDGAACHAIQVTSADGARQVVLYVDKKTKALAGMSYQDGELASEERYADYKAVGGIQVAHSRITKSTQVDLTTTISDVKLDEAIDPAVFAKPSSK